jgi:hypothetical protein
MRRKHVRAVLGAALMLVLAGFVSGPLAQDQKSAEPTKGAEAMFLLKYMAEYLSGARQLQVGITSGYDVVQPTGQKIEFREARQVTLVRPSKMRVETERDDGRKTLVLFDGSNVSAFDPGRKVMATASRPGDIDGAVKYFVRDLKMRIPLAVLFTAGFPGEVEERVTSAEVVQRVTLLDVPCLQIAARGENVDFQVWIPEKGEPLPRRIVITYRNELGQPQFWADFSHWNLATDVPESAFTFTPPDGTEKVPFLAEIANVSGTPKTRGGRK